MTPWIVILFGVLVTASLVGLVLAWAASGQRPGWNDDDEFLIEWERLKRDGL